MSKAAPCGARGRGRPSILPAFRGIEIADVTAHVPGTFSWPELATTDQRGAVAFYQALFGWEVKEQPIGPTETYSLFQMRGREVSAACAMRADERQAGIPPHWNAYVTVADVDATVARAAELGGTVLAQPFDVMDAGRMAVLQDPTGAVFQVWQAKRSIGARIVGEPGSLCWTELATRDTGAAEAFYTALFGWVAKHGPADSPMPYTEFSVKGAPGIGMMPMPPQVPSYVPAYWTPYFMVADVNASAVRVSELGGQVIVGPQDIPNAGRFAVVTDPQGAMFSIFTPKA